MEWHAVDILLKLVVVIQFESTKEHFHDVVMLRETKSLLTTYVHPTSMDKSLNLPIVDVQKI